MKIRLRVRQLHKVSTDFCKNLHSFIQQSVLRNTHTLFQRKFLARWDLMLPPSVSSIFSFSWVRSPSSYLRLLPRLHITCTFHSIFPWITCFKRQFLRKIWPIQLTLPHFIVHRIFLASLVLRNISSFLTRSVQLIFYILL